MTNLQERYISLCRLLIKLDKHANIFSNSHGADLIKIWDNKHDNEGKRPIHTLSVHGWEDYDETDDIYELMGEDLIDTIFKELVREL